MIHFYKDIEGFMSDKNKIAFDFIIPQLPTHSVWVELGSWTGKSTAYCVVELKNQNKFGDFYCVDTWEGGPEHQENQLIKDKTLYEIFETNIKPVIDDVHIIKSLSWDSSKRFADNSVDVCYVDAGHEYECVVKDIVHFWPKIKVGGWLFGDDFTKSFPGVQKAVREFAISNNVSVQRKGRCWCMKKETQ